MKTKQELKRTIQVHENYIIVRTTGWPMKNLFNFFTLSERILHERIQTKTKNAIGMKKIKVAVVKCSPSLPAT